MEKLKWWGKWQKPTLYFSTGPKNGTKTDTKLYSNHVNFTPVYAVKEYWGAELQLHAS